MPDLPPVTAAFMTSSGEPLLAVGYRNHPVLVWNILDLEPLGQCATTDNNGIDDMEFNPNPEIIALVASYNDGRLCLIDYVSMELVFVMPGIFAQNMNCTADGRSLVTGSSQGTIEVFEFDQSYNGTAILTPIYRIDALGDSIRGVAFNPEGLRFADVQGAQCRVGAPAALVRRNNELESTSDAMTLTTTATGVSSDRKKLDITSSLVASADGRYVLAGKRGGAVCLFSADDGLEVGALYKHAASVSIMVVALGVTARVVASADDSGRVLVADSGMPLSNIAAMAQKPGQKAESSLVVLDRRFKGVVASLLLNSDEDRLLVGGRGCIELWELPSGRMVANLAPTESPTSPKKYADGRWVRSFSAPEQRGLVCSCVKRHCACL